jgi:hypothetical protein
LALDPVAKLPEPGAPKVQALFEAARGEASPAQPNTERLAVFDFEANGSSPQAASAATGAVAAEIERLGVFAVLSADNLRNLLSLERQKQLLGCSDDRSQCMTELAGAIGVRYLVTGKLSRLPGKAGEAAAFTLELNLLDADHARRLASVVVPAASEREVVLEAPSSTGKLLASLLAAHRGYVELDCPERGAEVRVDGTTVATTPLKGPLALPAGTHSVEVVKEGFSAFRTDVRVQPNQKVSLVAMLDPSPDFLEHYESRESKLRLGAWVCTGLAVVGGGTAGIFAYRSLHFYGNVNSPGTFLYDKAKLQAGIESDSGGDYRDGANGLKARIQSANTYGYVAAGVGGAAALAAAAFWIVGDDPHRYDGRPRLVLAPTLGGGALTLEGAF